MITGTQRWYTVASRINQAVYDGLTVKPSRSGVVPGDIAWDSGCGVLATSVGPIYMSDDFPKRSSEVISAQCTPAYEVADIGLQLVRCVPNPDAQGNPPTAKALDTAAASWAADAGEVISAVNRVLCQMRAADDISGALLQTMTPVGPEGGLVAVEIHMLVGLDHG
jgi:hypothetical protein